VNPLPCVVFAFNRPNKLTRILDALKDQQIDQLIIFIDGPREKEDLEKVEACRTLARRIDWVETELYLRNENHGLPGISDNISLVFEKHTWAVFVEDDCLPMPGFYGFMRQALERYQEYKQIFSIGGYQPIKVKFFRENPHKVISCARFMCWGWGTWQDRWKSIYIHQSNYKDLFENLQSVPDSCGADLPLMVRNMASGKTKESWDVKVAVACLWLEMVNLLPTRGLIKNIGLNPSGVHGSFLSIIRGMVFHNKNVARSPLTDLRWLEDTSLDQNYMREFREWVDQEQRFSSMWYKARHFGKRIFRRGR